MRVLKYTFATLGVLCAISSLMGLISRDIALPINSTIFGLISMVISKEYGYQGNEKSSKYFFILSILMFISTIIFLGLDHFI